MLPLKQCFFNIIIFLSRKYITLDIKAYRLFSQFLEDNKQLPQSGLSVMKGTFVGDTKFS